MYINPRQLLLLFAILFFNLLNIAFANPSASETPQALSPYFFIEGGDSAIDKLPLKTSHTDVQLNGFIASVKLTQQYRNEGNQAINARYIFPGSTGAAVNGMTMTIGERRIAAKIKEKQQAKKVFEAAKKAGKSASLLSQKRPNVFSMGVANILPGDAVTIELTYTEIITAEQGIYGFVYPGVVGPRYGGDAPFSEDETQWIANPYLAEGTPDAVKYGIDVTINSPVAISSLESTTHTMDTQWLGTNQVKLSLNPQQAESAGNRDFILHYRLQDNEIISGLSQFSSNGENYFLMVSQPPKKPRPEIIPARDYFFIIDVSGSMSGFPLDTTKALMAKLLNNLTPEDRFNILFFSGGSKLLSPQPLTASPSNIARAQAMMGNLRGGGGTNLFSAMEKAFAMQSDENASRNMVLITDGYISAERRVFELIDQQLHRNNVFAFGIGSSVNRFLIEGVAKAGRSEAFVVTSRTDAAQQAQRFYDYIAAPTLTNISIMAEGVELYDLEPKHIPDMLAERPIMVIGKYRNDKKHARITLNGVNGDGAQQWSFPLKKAQTGDPTLPQLWARKQLERLYVLPEGDKDQQRQQIVDLGLKYSLLTKHTSFVAVDETIRNTKGDSKDVKQPLPLPEGVSNNAIGRPMPEPELWLLGLIVSLLGGFRVWRSKRRG